MRTYQPSWIELKNSESNPKHIRISAPAKFHRRIYKAIIKEKDMDLVYKLQCSDNAQKARLSRNSSGGILTIFLHLTIGLTDF